MTQESLLTVRPVATGEGPASTQTVSDATSAPSATALPVPQVNKTERGSGAREQATPDSNDRNSAALEDIRDAVERLQAKLAELRQSGVLRRTRLEFEMDDELTDRIIVKIIDTETDEVVREVPPRELVEFAKRLSEAMGVILDTFA